MTTLIFADVETTGVRTTDRVVEVAWLTTDEHLNIQSTAHSLINPQIPIPSGASAVHNIYDVDVANSPTLEAFMDLHASLWQKEDVVFVAHNAAFDIRYLGPYIHPKRRECCTLRLARKHLQAENHKLQTLRETYGLEAGAAHSAHGDVTTLLSLFRTLCQVTEQTPAELVAQASLPMQVDRMPFGKHKGMPLQDIPRDYRAWLLNLPDLDRDLRHSLTNL